MIFEVKPALSVARPVAVALAAGSFRGWVQAVFRQACNLVNGQGRIITVALPEVGQGPFTVLIEGQPGLFAKLAPGQPVLSHQNSLTLGTWRIELAGSQVWEPQLPLPGQPLQITPLIANVMGIYRAWPPVDSGEKIQDRVASKLNQAVERFTQALQSDEAIPEAAGWLAGLGPGLTPAGDDYLLGVIAALWLAGQIQPIQKIVAAAISRTTLLSGAFLEAAAQGDFSEPWHHLAQALEQGDISATAEACRVIRGWGATSGPAAMAGFANTLLKFHQF